MRANSTKLYYWKRVFLLFLSVGLLSAGLSVFFQIQTHSQIAKGPTIDVVQNPYIGVVQDSFLNNEVAEDFSIKIDSGSSFDAPDKPARILIPSIGVDTTIQSVGLTDSGNMGIPSNFTEVAWYNRGVAPGMPGSAVIAGHVDGRNVPEAIFYDLNKLTLGDVVKVIDKRGKILEFKVVNVVVYEHDAPTEDVFLSNDSKSRLNLITCSGDWIADQRLYTKRTVVFTELVTPV